jgi:hypothetical protein
MARESLMTRRTRSSTSLTGAWAIAAIILGVVLWATASPPAPAPAPRPAPTLSVPSMDSAAAADAVLA